MVLSKIEFKILEKEESRAMFFFFFFGFSYFTGT